jgi:hypothetical protein
MVVSERRPVRPALKRAVIASALVGRAAAAGGHCGEGPRLVLLLALTLGLLAGSTQCLLSSR